MKFALSDNKRIQAIPYFKGAVCPICQERVIAKCGSIKQWHWSHKSIFDCDSFAEPESEWHLNWKNKFPDECIEVVIGQHRADIKTKSKDSLNGFPYQSEVVIELQNSSISPKEIIERELFYKNMIWLFNGETFAKNLDLRSNGSYITFRWKHPPKTLWTINKPIYIDLDSMVKSLDSELSRSLNSLEKIEKSIEENWTLFIAEKFILEENIRVLLMKIELYEGKLFSIKKIYPNVPCGGWGRFVSKTDFIKRYSGKENDTPTIQKL